MIGGFTEKTGRVNLSTGEIDVDSLPESVARDFIGGYGLGVHTLFRLQRAGADPLGPENILGFFTGPLTGTKTPTGGRYMAVAKSPLTGGWGDANSGGFFGSALKAAGWDAIFVSGIAPYPQYLLVTDDKIEIKPAYHLWGKDTVETEDILRKELNAPKLKVACIGPASEKLSLISGIVNDKGRIAARSGLGAVMGSKKLKAFAVIGSGKVRIANEEWFGRLRKNFLKSLKGCKGFPEVLMTSGTCGITEAYVASGAAPVKNWLLSGEQAFPGVSNLGEGHVLKYQSRKFGCSNCPIACGGIIRVDEGPYPVGETHKPEYETIAAFGPNCLNDDLLSIIKLGDMCNRSGLDSISAGSVIAFAMECFENGLITKSDTGGIELTWGNTEAMIAMLGKIVRREGLGDILADGVKIAARKLGAETEPYAMHVGGQEPGMSNALYQPSRATGFICDPTPGRHTTAVHMAAIDNGSAVIGPYPGLHFHGFERYDYGSKGKSSATASSYWQVGACAGLCIFPVIFFGNFPLIEFLNAVVGWDMGIDEALETGARIQTLRLAFNQREGLEPSNIRLAPRLEGIPPKEEGPLAGITIDSAMLTSEYRKAMGWDPKSGYPDDATLERLGLKVFVEENW